MQNALVNGIKECFVLQAENSPQHFQPQNLRKFKSFRGFEKAKAGDPPQGGDSCFGAIADADSNKNDSDFEIYMDGNGVAVKTCSHGENAGCTATAADGKGTGTW